MIILASLKSFILNSFINGSFNHCNLYVYNNKLSFSLNDKDTYIFIGRSEVNFLKELEGYFMPKSSCLL